MWLRVTVSGRACQFSWSLDGERFTDIGPVLDMSRLSDEYCSYGEFTGTVAGIFCVDRMFRRKCADFDFLEYLENSPVKELRDGKKDRDRCVK